MFHSQRHVVVVQSHPGPLHRLAPEDSIPPMAWKNGRAVSEAWTVNCLQPLRAWRAETSALPTPPALGIPVDVQPVQITGFGHIAEAHNFACQPGHQSIMGQEARLPALDAGAASPGSQLRPGYSPWRRRCVRFR